MSFEIGDKVRGNNPDLFTDGHKWAELVGTIENVESNSFGVRFPGLINKYSKDGLFWFAGHHQLSLVSKKDYSYSIPTIDRVYFNEPYVIVIWSDKTKTIVKVSDNDTYDPEKGLAMAVSKKFLGTNKNRSNYYDIFKKWLPEEGSACGSVNLITETLGVQENNDEKTGTGECGICVYYDIPFDEVPCIDCSYSRNHFKRR